MYVSSSLTKNMWIYMGILILIQSLVNLDFDLALVGSPSSPLARAFSYGSQGFAGTSDLGASNL